MKKIILFALLFSVQYGAMAQRTPIKPTKKTMAKKPAKQLINEVGIGVGVFNFSLPLKNAIDSAERALITVGVNQNFGKGIGIQYGFAGGNLREFKFDTARIQQSFTYKIGASLHYRLDNGYILKEKTAIAPFVDFGVNRLFVERQQDGVLEEFKVNYLNYGAGVRFKISNNINFKYQTNFNKPLGNSNTAHWQHNFGVGIRITPSAATTTKRDLRKDLQNGNVASDNNPNYQDFGSDNKENTDTKSSKNKNGKSGIKQTKEPKPKPVKNEKKRKTRRERNAEKRNKNTKIVDINTPLPPDSTDVAPPNQTAPAPAAWDAQPSAPAPAGYYIVVASPDNADEALSEKDRIQGAFTKAKVYFLPTDNGRYRVGMYAGTNANAANKLLTETRQKLQPAAWKASYAQATNAIEFVRNANQTPPQQTTSKPEPTPEPISINTNIPKGYYAIVSSFPQLETAQKYGAEVASQYPDLYIMQHENMYRVGIFTKTSNPKTADEALKRVRIALDNQSIWKLLID